MKFDNLVEIIENMEGNYSSKTGGLYILPANIERLSEMINNCDDLQSILITPFLITVNGGLYELHYYEFEIEIGNVSKSYYVEYQQGNVLPPEIIKNIKPKAMVSNKDKDFFINAVDDYFTAMRKMTFESDRLSNIALNDANLYFQIC